MLANVTDDWFFSNDGESNWECDLSGRNDSLIFPRGIILVETIANKNVKKAIENYRYLIFQV